MIYSINLILQMFWAKKCVECHLSFTSSALDAESERVVQEALDKVTKGFKFTSIHSLSISQMNITDYKVDLYNNVHMRASL